VKIPLAWERRLWSGRSLGERYILTDLRLVRVRRGRVDELAIHDIGEVQRTESRLKRRLGVSTVIVQARDGRRPPLILRRVRRGAQLAALVEFLAGDPHAAIDVAAVRAALDWEPRLAPARTREAFAGLAAVAIAIFAVAIGLHGKAGTVAYPADDAIYPSGQKKTRADIVWFMEREVMPWARVALAPIKGGSDRIACETCHGAGAAARGWKMPAVAALPQPDVRDRGWETYGGRMDAQMRNAIYGYIAESDKQAKAAYMREVVMPGMARLLHRPAYDFTRTYEYNRTRLAFGCYHCHMVKSG
jgi:hypothetical protein